MRRLWHRGLDPWACHRTAYTSQHLIQYLYWRWAASSTGFTLLLLSSVCLCLTELPSACHVPVQSWQVSRTKSTLTIELKEWGHHVQRKPQAISSEETLKKLSWFLYLPTCKLAGLTNYFFRFFPSSFQPAHALRCCISKENAVFCPYWFLCYDCGLVHIATKPVLELSYRWDICI